MTVKSPLLRIACVRASRGVALKNPICEYYRQDLVDGRIRSGHVPLSLLPKWIPVAMCGSLNVRASTAIGLEASWPREMKNKERCFIYIYIYIRIIELDDISRDGWRGRKYVVCNRRWVEGEGLGAQFAPSSVYVRPRYKEPGSSYRGKLSSVRIVSTSVCTQPHCSVKSTRSLRASTMDHTVHGPLCSTTASCQSVRKEGGRERNGDGGFQKKPAK